MKIAYVTTGNPHDKNSWSGTDHYAYTSIVQAGGGVYFINIPKVSRWRYAFKKLYYKLIGKDYQYQRSVAFCKHCAYSIKKQLRPDTDAIFALGSLTISQLESSIPIFFYTDGVFSLTSKMYSWYSKMPEHLKREQDRIEREAMAKCTKAIVSSKCVVDEMTKHYGFPANKIELVPMGANIDTPPSQQTVENAITNLRSKHTLRLLFVGVDWIRKGGGLVLDTAKDIQRKGVDVRVDLVGCKDIPQDLPEFVEDHGFLSKNNPLEYEKLSRLYLDAHFLFVPSMGECYGLVFCEASAFGVPSISHEVGGIPTIVRNGINGYLFPLGTKPKDFAEKIVEVWQSDAYKTLCFNCRKEYESRLNWKVAGKSLLKIMEIAVNQTVTKK